MTITLAFAGKGGTGKTTLAALFIQILAEKGTVLAIDGDPATNLNMALGMPLADTIGDIREEMLTQVKSGSFAPGIAKQDYLELKVQESLVESERVDLLAMGRPEGPGCYCAANSMLRQTLDRMGKSYDYVVMDCEAGMEHISRQTTRDVDILLLITDPSMRGVVTASRMKDLIGEIRTRVGRIGLVVNRKNGPLSPELARVIEEEGLELLAILPDEPLVMELEGKGAAVVELPPDSPLRRGVLGVVRKLGLTK